MEPISLIAATIMLVFDTERTYNEVTEAVEKASQPAPGQENSKTWVDEIKEENDKRAVLEMTILEADSRWRACQWVFAQTEKFPEVFPKEYDFKDLNTHPWAIRNSCRNWIDSTRMNITKKLLAEKKANE